MKKPTLIDLIENMWPFSEHWNNPIIKSNFVYSEESGTMKWVGLNDLSEKKLIAIYKLIR